MKKIKPLNLYSWIIITAVALALPTGSDAAVIRAISDLYISDIEIYNDPNFTHQTDDDVLMFKKMYADSIFYPTGVRPQYWYHPDFIQRMGFHTRFIDRSWKNYLDYTVEVNFDDDCNPFWEGCYISKLNYVSASWEFIFEVEGSDSAAYATQHQAASTLFDISMQQAVQEGDFLRDGHLYRYNASVIQAKYGHDEPNYAFLTITNASLFVPEPSSFLLFVSGVAGFCIAFILRKKATDILNP